MPSNFFDQFDGEKQPASGGNFFDRYDHPDQQPGEFRKGVSSGIDQLQAIGGGAAGLIGSAVGSDRLRDWGLDVYTRNTAEAAENPAKVPDVTEIKSLGEAKDWLVYQVGNQLPILIGTMGAGGAGGIIGRKVAEKGLEAGIKGAAVKAMERRAAELTATGVAEPLAARQAAQEVASEIVAKGTQAGALAGAGAGSYGVEAGSIFGDINEKTGEMRPGVAAAFAAPAAMLDVLPIGMVFKRLGVGEAAKQGVESVLKREGWAKAIAKQIGAEGVTEGMQTVVERAAVQWVDENKKVFTPEGWNEIINAAAAGGAVGGVVGAGGKALEGTARSKSSGELVERLRSMSSEAAARAREQATADAVSRIGQATSIDEAIQHAVSATSGASRAELTPEPMFESDVAGSPVEGLIGGQMGPAIDSAVRATREQPAYDQLAAAKDADLNTMVDQRRDIEADAATQESLRAEREAAAAPAAPQNEAMRIAFEKATLKRMEAMQAKPAASIDEAAHQAAPSPQNERAEPTDGQKEAGNYKKGQVKLSGLAISVENPQGSTRSGVGPDGKPWSNTLHDHYGYIKGVPARAPDKEHVDVFIKPGTPENYAGNVYIVDQNNEKNRFDEPKVMIGYDNVTAAREGYLRNYTPGWKGLRNITPAPMAKFKEMLLDPDAFMKPQAFVPQYYLDEKNNRRRLEPGITAPAGARIYTDVQAVDKARKAALMDARRADPGRDSINEWIAKRGGVDITERLDTIGDDQNQAFNASQWLFRHKGEKMDELARRAVEDGYLTQAEADDVDGGVQALKDKIRDEFSGIRRHYSHANTQVQGEDEAKRADEDDLLRRASDFDIPTIGVELEDIRKAVRQREETEAALQETEADKEARLEREAIQADNLQPDDGHANDDIQFDGEQGARQGEGSPGGSDENSVAQPKGEYPAKVDAGAREPAGGDQAPAGERRQADEKGSLAEPSAQYNVELEASRDAARKFQKITEDYRARRIGDTEYLAGRREFEASQKRFDEAERKEKSASKPRAPKRTADTMSDAIALSSPNGQMSKRAKDAAVKRLGTSLFGEGGLEREQTAQPTEAARLLDQAQRLRELADRGMNAGKYRREAARLERRAADLAAERPALDLKSQTPAELEAKDKQAKQGAVEEKTAAQRDRNEAILTAPAGTAPPRDAAAQKVPTQQDKLFEPAAEYSVQTPAFKKWFGESKVVDKAGKPLVVYHGTPTKGRAINKFRMPAYFTEEPTFAEMFAREKDTAGGALYPAYLRIENPYIIDAAEQGRHFEWDAEDVERMKSEGFDGVVVRGDEGESDIYTVFDQGQVKSAVGNRGTFDANNPDILREPAPLYDLDEDGPRLVGDGVAIVQPSKWESRGDLTYYEHLILDLKTKKVVGNVTLGWRGDKVGQLLNIRIFGGNQTKGLGEAVVRSILEQNGDAELHVAFIATSAEGFWRKMGVRFIQTDEGNDGIANLETYRAARPGAEGAHAQPADAAGTEAGGAAKGERSGSETPPGVAEREVPARSGRAESAQRAQTPTGQFDLFAAGPVPGTPAKTLEKIVVEPARKGTLHIGYDRLDTSAKAAQAFSALRKSPRERFQMIGVDENYKPVAAFDLFAGNATQTSVHPREVFTALYQTPGVRKVWVAHNHPSGTPQPSQADERLTKTLMEGLTDDIGIELLGHVIIAGTRAIAFEEQNRSGDLQIKGLGADVNIGAAFDIPAASRKFAVPIMERTVRKAAKLGEPLTNPDAMRAFIKASKFKESGLIFLSARHAPIAWWPMSIDEMRKLRTGDLETGAAKLFRAIGRNNAISAVAYTPFNSGGDFTVGMSNLARALARVDVRLMDGFVPEAGTKDGRLMSLQERGTTFDIGASDTPFFRRGETSRGAGAAAVRTDLVKAYGEKGIKSLEDAGFLELTTSADPRLAPIRSQMEGTDAVYWKGKAWLLADRMVPGQAPNRLLHELGEHHGLEEMLGKDAYAKLLGRVETMYKGGNPAVRDAWALVTEKYDYKAGSPEFMSEVIAAMTEDARVTKQTWWQDLLAAVKAWLAKRGLGINDEKDVLTLLRASLNKVMREAGEPVAIGEAQPAFSKPPEHDIFYSDLARRVADVKMNTAPAAQWKATIKGMQGIKADEVEWSGINEWLDAQSGKVTKEQVNAFLDQNGVKVTETVLGESGSLKDAVGDLVVQLDAKGYDVEWAPDLNGEANLPDSLRRRSDGRTFYFDPEMQAPADETTIDDLPEDVGALAEQIAGMARGANIGNTDAKFQDYTLPGGENYRELLLTLPTRKQTAQEIALRLYQKPLSELTADERANAEAIERDPTDYKYSGFRSSHFDQPNILAHVRFDERTDADGKKVLFIEEIQSDWAQKGKRSGFASKEEDQAKFAELEREYDALKRKPRSEESQARINQLMDEMNAIHDRRNYGVPKAPFVGKTEAWVGLALRRMIRYAADNGFDRVAWTTGNQQADRYDLSKHVSAVRWANQPGETKGSLVAFDHNDHAVLEKDIPESRIADYVGKDVAARLLDAEKTETGRGREMRNLSGVDLKVGGEGMMAFYDKLIPNIANDLLKKMGGARVAKIPVGLTKLEFKKHQRRDGVWRIHEVTPDGDVPYGPPVHTEAAADSVLARLRNENGQPGFDITPEMRDLARNGLPMFSRPAIAASRTTGDYRDTVNAGANSFVRDLLHTDATFNWWHKSIGTQQHKALSNAEFKPVYDESQAFLADVSKYANEAADQAKSLLPRIEGFADFKKSSPSQGDIEGATQALYAGTLWGGGSPLEGRIWTDEELRSGRAKDGKLSVPAFKPLDDKQIVLYRQALASISKSLDELGKSLIHRQARQHDIGFDRGMGLEDVAATVRDAADAMIDAKNDQVQTLQDPAYISQMEDAARSAALGTRAGDRAAKEVRRKLAREVDRVEKEIAEIEALKAGVTDIEQKTAALKDRGYFPAMRFGQFAVHVVRDVKGQTTPEQLYFGLFESQTKANLAARELEREFPGARIERGIVSKEQHKLFQGMSLDALETFADYMTGEDGQPLSKNPLVQGFLKAAVAERSSLKRHIHRKGVAGYSDDLPRVLASFTVSSARTASSNYHSAEMLRLAGDVKAGDVKDEAIKLVRYLMDPQEEAQALRGFLFAQFLGGSIAHGLVNMTQPFMVTVPYLSQYTSAVDAMAKMGAAATTNPAKLTGKILDAYQRAKSEGVVAPQEIHQLRAETGGLPIAKSLALRKLSFLWGSIYAVTEQFNRTTAFLAAYRVAEAKGMDDPYTFAANAVNETQFVYNKGNRPNWARGPVGATVFTFKQFSIAYLELGKRIFAKDKKAFALMTMALLAGAGVQGLPFAEDLEDLIDTIGQWMGYATNTKKALRKWATEQLGPEMAQVVLHGVSGFSWMPVDVSTRLGLQNLIPGTSMLKLSETNKAKDVLELVGPIGQFVPTEDTMVGKALERISKGDMFGAVKSAAPVAIQNVAKGAEMLSTGEARDTKGKKIMPVTPAESVLKMAGLQPASVARASERVGDVMQDINLQKRMESEIAEQWARAIVDGHPGEINAAVAKLMEWNRDNPELRIKVTGEQIRSRVKSMRTGRDERLTKSAPPEVRANVREQLR